MKGFIQFFAQLFLVFFICFGSIISLFGQTQNEEEGENIFFGCPIEQNAVFEGGMDNFYEIVNNQMRFSDTMKEGRVFIQFVVNEEGKVSEIKVVKGLSEENDKEALRIMTLISEHYDWIPAKQRDKTVKVRMNIPILFKRQEQLKSNTERVYKR